MNSVMNSFKLRVISRDPSASHIEDTASTQTSMLTAKIPDLDLVNNLRNKVTLEFDETLKVTVQFSQSTGLTSEWLFNKLVNKLRQQVEDSEIKSRIDLIVALKTKNQNLMADVLLTTDDYPLTFLERDTILIPYMKPENSKIKEKTDSRVSLEDFEFSRQFGAGGFSKVFLARKKDTGKFFAIKQQQKKESARQKVSVMNERDLLIDVKRDDFVTPLKYCFQTDQYYYMAMKFFVRGDLKTFITQNGPFTEEVAKYYAAQILVGLEILHRMNLIFRDLKPENILVDEKGHLYIGDLGFCMKVSKDDLPLKNGCGTLEYMAPEMLAKKGYDFRADLYSFGVVVFELLHGVTPFSLKKIGRPKFESEVQNTNPTISKHLSANARDFLKKLLSKTPNSRLGALEGIKEIKEHPWLNGVNFTLVEQRKLPLPITEAPFLSWIGRNKPSKVNVEVDDSKCLKSWLKKYTFCFEDLTLKLDLNVPSLFPQQKRIENYEERLLTCPEDQIELNPTSNEVETKQDSDDHSELTPRSSQAGYPKFSSNLAKYLKATKMCDFDKESDENKAK